MMGLQDDETVLEHQFVTEQLTRDNKTDEDSQIVSLKCDTCNQYQTYNFMYQTFCV